MTHTYNSVTTPTTTYIPVSDVTPSGTVEEKFTWANIVPNQDTWLELLVNGGKIHWVDWLFGTAFTDLWTAITMPSKAYSGVSKADNSYSPLTTPAATYSEVTK